jgi:hypothetical protein
LIFHDVLIYEFSYLELINSCVSKWWTMQAKAAFVSETNANTLVWSTEMGRYRDLRSNASAALFKASKRTERSQQVMDFSTNHSG